VELGVAAAEDRVVSRRALIEEQWFKLGQRTRILEQERVGDRRGEVIEAVIALEQATSRATVAAAAAAEFLAAVPEGMSQGLVDAHARVDGHVARRRRRRHGAGGRRRHGVRLKDRVRRGWRRGIGRWRRWRRRRGRFIEGYRRQTAA